MLLGSGSLSEVSRANLANKCRNECFISEAGTQCFCDLVFDHDGSQNIGVYFCMSICGIAFGKATAIFKNVGSCQGSFLAILHISMQMLQNSKYATILSEMFVFGDVWPPCLHHVC